MSERITQKHAGKYKTNSCWGWKLVPQGWWGKRAGTANFYYVF